jgi:hypothetical protein
VCKNVVAYAFQEQNGNFVDLLKTQLSQKPTVLFKDDKHKS